MESPWNEILFFPGEDAEALKTRFVEVWARYRNRTAYEVAAFIFKDLKDPSLRQGKAAEIWGNDLDVLERVRVLALKGLPTPDCSESDLIRRALQIADGDGQDKDRLAAIRLAGELQGFVKKSVEAKVVGGANDNASEFLAALASRLPA